MGYRILLINWRDIDHPEAGGAEVHAHEIFRRIAARGHRVTLLCAAWTGGAPEAEIDGIEVLRRGHNLTFNFTVDRLLKSRDFTSRFDIVVEDLNKIPFLTPWCTGLPRLILFHHLFGSTIFREAAPPLAAYVWLWERLMVRLAYRREWAQAVSRDTAEELARMGLDPRRIRIVHNGIDCELYRPPQAGESPPLQWPYFLYMGRVKRYKRLEMIIKAYARARSLGLDDRIRLVFAGAGDDYPRLRRVAEVFGLTERVSFLGRVSQPEKVRLLGHALAVLNSSPKEGWGITNIEAQACGAPVVASRSPGLRESVRDGVTGFLFEPGPREADAVERFAPRLVELAADPALRERLSRAAREFACGFSWDEAASKTLEYLEFILDERTMQARGGPPDPEGRR